MLLIFCYAVAHAQEAVKIKGPENAAKLTFRPLNESQLLISVLDAGQKPILGLQPKDFSITRGRKSGKILSVVPLETSKDIALNVVLVVDNSSSMKQREAVQPLRKALGEFFSVIRPKDNIHAVVYDKKKITLKGNEFHVRTFQSNKSSELGSFFKESYTEDRLTGRTYLYDSMFVGLDIISRMPEKSNKFLLVFTDGEDNGSQFGISDLKKMAKDIPNFSAYALDFTETKTPDTFLKSFSEAHDGRIWKAASSDEIVPIFKSFSTALLHRYVLTYRFFDPPEGTLALDPKTVVIEEVTTIDSSPLLNYVFFESGQGEIPGDYVLFSSQSEAVDFSEKALSGPMQKYRHVLNIIGKRLLENPDASITIVGCNSNQGQEKGNIALSQSRAEAVQRYLQGIWGIDLAKMKVTAQNLPKAPSTSSRSEGIAENQRVEIYSDHPAVLDIIKSTYVQEVADTKALRILPQIQAEAGIAQWKMELKGEDGTVIDSVSGEGDITSDIAFNLVPSSLSKIASFKTLTASVEVTDREGETLKSESAATTDITFIKREQMKAKKKGYRVLEQYALILFEYDSAKIKERNKAIVDRIVARMGELPSAEVQIVGHTDTIGKENYNVKLSKKRAKAVYDQIIAAGTAPDANLTFTGVGPHDPLYDNAEPEGRALNRTVTVTLEYEGID